MLNLNVTALWCK